MFNTQIYFHHPAHPCVCRGLSLSHQYNTPAAEMDTCIRRYERNLGQVIMETHK